jgi:hypothetical protein
VGNLRAKVVNGRLVLDEPIDLPEGTVLELVVADIEDDLDENERRELDAALDRAWTGLKAGGPVRPLQDLIDELRKTR